MGNKTKRDTAKQGIDILTKDGKIDYNKIKAKKKTTYNDLQGEFKEIEDILYSKNYDDDIEYPYITPDTRPEDFADYNSADYLDISKPKKKSRGFDMER